MSFMNYRLNGHKGHIHLGVWPLRLDLLSRRVSWASRLVERSVMVQICISSLNPGDGLVQMLCSECGRLWNSPLGF